MKRVKPLKIFAGTTGINNRLDPVRLKFQEGAIVELALGVNIDIDDSGRPSRRMGSLVTAETGDCHSLFCEGSTCLFVKTTGLYILHIDYSSTGIRNVTQGARMDYEQVGERIYYLNGFERGYVKDGSSYTWTVGDYVGPDTVKTFSNPPTGHLLTLYNGRMFIAEGDIVWYSEPFAYNAYNLAKNYIQCRGRVRILQHTDAGIVIGTDKEIVTYTGPNPEEWVRKKVAPNAALEGTAVEVDAPKVKGVIFASREGLCLVEQDNNKFTNLTEERLNYPSAVEGSGLYRDGKYICLLKP